MTTTATVIPTIRLDSSDHGEIVCSVRQACLKYGFFYCAGHGIDPTLIEEVFQQSKLLFDLPIEDKVALSDHEITRGYTAMQEETLDPLKQIQGDTKEGYYISINDIPRGNPRFDPKKLRGPNQWPTQQLPDFKPTMTRYLEAVTPLSRRIVALLAESLDLPDDYFDDAFREPIGSLRLLHYSQTKSNTDAGIYGAGAHTDYGMITLLYTDENDGLEIFDKLHSKEWIPVPPITGSFVVNLGDMLERWTNGMYTSTLHRVINKNGNERYSIPFFFEPSFDAVVECLSTCCSEDKPPKFPPITAGEHLVSKYSQTHANFVPSNKH